MVTRNKRIIVFLAAVWLSGSMISVCCAQSPIKPPSDNSASSLLKHDPNLWTGTNGGLSTRELFYKMTLAVLLVVVLGTAAIYISKKFVPRITGLSGKKIQVLETVHLGPRQLLIGSTNESVTKLADVTDTLTETNLSAKNAADL
jgi:hypothetical protein